MSIYRNTAQNKPDSPHTVLTGGLILIDPSRPRILDHGATILSAERLDLVNLRDYEARPEDHTLDCSGCLIMPGLVNAHCHSPMSLLRGVADDLSLDRWLHGYIFPAEARHVDPDFVRLGATLSAVEMALGGITTFADGYFHMEHAAAAVVDVGLRAIIAQGILDLPTPDAPQPGSWKERVDRFFSSFPDDPRVKPALFCHSPYLCSPETLTEAGRLAKDHETLLFTHVSETAWEVEQTRDRYSTSPVEHLHNLELLGNGLVLVHGVHLIPREKSLLAETGTGLVHCPESNMKLASGAAPVRDLVDKGVTVAIGTDGPASNNNLDLFEEMRSASLMAKLVTRDPEALDARTVLKMATTEGARALGMHAEIGSLEPGKLADLIVLDLDRPHLTPVYDPISHLVYSARGSDVRDVFVGGKRVVDHGRLTTLDVEELKRTVRLLGKAIARELGIDGHPGG